MAAKHPNDEHLLTPPPDAFSTGDPILERVEQPVTVALPPRPPTTSGDGAPTTSGVASPAARAPRHFGKYELVEEIACGGMGIVYQARDSLLGRTVALKMIRAGVLANRDEVLRFQREARAAALLDHRNIIPILEIGEEDGQHYFTMPYATGGPLSHQLKRIGANIQTAVRLMEAVARAVHCAHENHILHRDLKPANILLDEQDQPFVGDFGLAKFLDASADLTQTGQQLGTPAYMAPEQAAGTSEIIGVQTDVWALGVILYELLTGTRPFAGRGRDEVVRCILSTEPSRPRSLRPQLDTALEAVLLKCLEKDPSKRYPSAGALAEDLGKWLQGEPPSVRPEGLSGRVRRGVRRHRLASAVGAVLALVVLAAAAVRTWTDPDRPLHRAERELAAGREVLLVGQTGLPLWSRPRLGQPAVTTSQQRGGTFAMESFGLSLLELLPSAPPAGYRFSGEIRHELIGDSLGYTGFYVLHSEHPTRNGQEHCFAAVAWDDLGRSLNRFTGKTDVFLAVRRYGSEAADHRADTRDRVAYTFIPARLERPTEQPPWRTFSIEVGPQEIRVTWDGRELGRTTLEGVRGTFKSLKAAGNLPDNCPELHPAFRIQDSLGLLVCRGKASFRNVVVAPRQ